MLEILKFVTTDIDKFIGSTIFLVVVIISLGWAIGNIVEAFK